MGGMNYYVKRVRDKNRAISISDKSNGIIPVLNDSVGDYINVIGLILIKNEYKQENKYLSNDIPNIFGINEKCLIGAVNLNVGYNIKSVISK
jgi:hypothetical protein